MSQTGMSGRGLRLMITTMNGEPKAQHSVGVGVKTEEQRFIDDVAGMTALDATAIRKALVTLAYNVEGVWREQRQAQGEEDTLPGKPLAFDDLAPWNTPVDGALLLDEIAWVSVRHAVLALYAQRCPGCRPWAWWLLEAPEPRQCLEGAHDCPGREDHRTRFPDRRLYYGRPGIYACPQCWDEQYESQPRYVRRLGLLLPAEEPVIPTDLAACDAWALERYEDDAVDPWEAGAALEGSETLLLELGGRL